MLASLGGRSSKTRAQRMPAALFPRESGMSKVALDYQGGGSLAEAPGMDFATLRSLSTEKS